VQALNAKRQLYQQCANVFDHHQHQSPHALGLICTVLALNQKRCAVAGKTVKPAHAFDQSSL